MKPRLVFFACVCLGALATFPFWAVSQEGKGPAKGSSSPVLSLEEVIARVQQNYEKIQTYQVEFEQEIFSMSQKRVISRGKGTVIYKKPGKMVWRYELPEEHYYIVNGDTIYDYTPAEKKAYVLSLQEAVYKSFLLGLGDLKKDFEISFHGGKPLTESGLYQLDLVPRNQADREAIGVLTLYLDPRQDFMVTFTQMVDPLENYNRMKYKNLKINLPLDDKLFQFKPPPGVKIIHAKDLVKEKDDSSK